MEVGKIEFGPEKKFTGNRPGDWIEVGLLPVEENKHEQTFIICVDCGELHDEEYSLCKTCAGANKITMTYDGDEEHTPAFKETCFELSTMFNLAAVLRKVEGSWGILADELNYYIAHQDELVAQYQGKALAIKGRQVIGVYETELEAINETTKTEELGTFIVQLCEPGEDNYTIYDPLGKLGLS